MNQKVISCALLLLLSFSGMAQIDFSPKLGKGEIITHTYYTLSYIEQHEQAEWVFYELTREDIEGTTKRVNSYRPDEDVPTGSAEAIDYKGSGYDRGHLAPAGDMKRSWDAMSESFYYSNMSPQVASFNQGIWNHLEIKVRNWVSKKNHIYIATGPVFEGNLDTIGYNKVTVPGFYYKVLLTKVEDNYQAIAFLLPNQLGTSELSQYAISVDDLENITKIDFWSALPDSIENNIESEIIIDDWFSKKELQRTLVKETAPIPLTNLPPNTINSADALNYVNETKTVCGCIVSTNYIKWASATYLNLDFKYPNHIFSLVIFGDNRNNFPDKPEDEYYGKKLCATGKVELLKGIPVIKLKDESSLQFLD